MTLSLFITFQTALPVRLEVATSIFAIFFRHGSPDSAFICSRRRSSKKYQCLDLWVVTAKVTHTLYGYCRPPKMKSSTPRLWTERLSFPYDSYQESDSQSQDHDLCVPDSDVASRDKETETHRDGISQFVKEPTSLGRLFGETMLVVE